MRLFPEVRAYPQTGIFPADAYSLRWVLRDQAGVVVSLCPWIPRGLFRADRAAERDQMVPALSWAEESARAEWRWLELHAMNARSVVHRVAVFHRSEAPEVLYATATTPDGKGVCHTGLMVRHPGGRLEICRDGHLVACAAVGEGLDEPVILNPEHLIPGRE